MANFTANDIDAKVTFDCEDKTIYLTDNTDYASFDDMPLANLAGTGQSLDPFGNIVFQVLTVGAPLIDLAGSDTVSSEYDLPLTTGNEIVNGTYTASYIVNANFDVVDLFVAQIGIILQEVVVSGDFTYLHAGDVLVFSDSTNVGNNGNKTVVSVVYDSGLDESTITFAGGSFTNNENGSDGTVVSWSIDRTYTKNFSVTFSGCNEVTPVVVIESSCSNESITIYDETVVSGQTVDSRSLVLIYPDGLVDPTPVSPVTTTDASISVDELANGTYTGTLTLNMSYIQTDGLEVAYQVYKAVEHAVSCTVSLCCLTDCIQALYAKYVPCEDGPVNLAYQSKVIQVSYLINEYNLLKACGDLDGAYAVAEQLSNLIGDDCTCCGDSTTDGPSWVNSGVSSPTSLQVYTALAEAAVPQSTGLSVATLPGQFFGTLGSVSGYVAMRVVCATSSNATITFRDNTTGSNIFTYALLAGDEAEFDLILIKKTSTTFRIAGNVTVTNLGTTVCSAQNSSVSTAVVLPNVTNAIRIFSSSNNTTFLSAEVKGYKIQ